MAKQANIARLTMKIDADVAELKKGLKSIQKQRKQTQDQFSGLGKIVAGAFAVSVIKDFVGEAMKLSSVANGVKKAFDKLGVPIDELRKSVKGTVSDLDLGSIPIGLFCPTRCTAQT